LFSATIVHNCFFNLLPTTRHKMIAEPFPPSQQHSSTGFGNLDSQSLPSVIVPKAFTWLRNPGAQIVITAACFRVHAIRGFFRLQNPIKLLGNRSEAATGIHHGNQPTRNREEGFLILFLDRKGTKIVDLK